MPEPGGKSEGLRQPAIGEKQLNNKQQPSPHP